MSSRLVRVLAGGGLRLTPMLIILTAWELATRQAANPFFPPPSRIVGHLHDLWFSGAPARLWLTADARANLVPSIARLLTGWAAAAALGITLGVALGRSPRLSDYLAPLTRFARAIPPTTLVPVFLAMFKIGTQMQLVTIICGTVWPIVSNTADGARSVDSTHLDTARVYGLSRWQRLHLIVLPSAAPKIVAGLRVSLPLAVILMALSEQVGATDGIGYRLLLLPETTLDLPALWGGIVLLGLLGYALNTMLGVFERRALAWHWQSRQTT